MTRAALVCATLVSLCGRLAAQELSFFAGAAHARYADSISGTAGFLSLRLETASSSAAGLLTGGFSQFVTGEWATQAGGYGTTVFAVSRNLAVGLAGAVDGNVLEGGIWSATAVGGPIVSLVFARASASLGVSLGGVWPVRGTFLPSTTGRASVRYLTPPFALDAGLTAVNADTLQYVDATGGASLEYSTMSLSVTGGIRRGDLSDDPWIRGGVEFRFSDLATLEAAAGRYPRDLTGFTDGLFVSAGVRMRIPRAPATDLGSAGSVRVRREDTNRVRVSIKYDEPAQHLAIAGEWNGWTPIPLVRDGDDWSVVLELDPGVYKFALIVDGDDWTVPPGAPTVPDDFGGRVALLVVRGPGR